jgi:hemerythrin-like domain-containing protein
MMVSKKTSRNQNDPLSIVAHERSTQYELCDELECIADQLGGPVDVQLCELVLFKLRHELPLHHRDEKILFDLLADHKPEDKVLDRCIELAVSEHSKIEYLAFEIADPISDLSSNIALNNPDAVGYLLRCSFEIIRQHLHWEDAVVFFNLENTFTEADKSILQAGLTRNRNLINGKLRIVD